VVEEEWGRVLESVFQTDLAEGSPLLSSAFFGMNGYGLKVILKKSAIWIPVNSIGLVWKDNKKDNTIKKGGYTSWLKLLSFCNLMYLLPGVNYESIRVTPNSLSLCNATNLSTQFSKYFLNISDLSSNWNAQILRRKVCCSDLNILLSLFYHYISFSTTFICFLLLQ